MFAAALPKGGHSIEEGAPDQHEISAGGDRLGNIKTRADAAIDNQRHLVADDSPNVRKLVKRMRRGVKLAATVIRDHQPVDTGARRAFGVLAVKNTLQQQLAGPAVTDDIQVIPVKTAIQLRADEFRDTHAAELVRIGLDIAESRAAIGQQAQRPFRT